MGHRLEESPLTVYVKFNELVGALKALLFCEKGDKGEAGKIIGKRNNILGSS
jgi:hypothetical protein